MIRTLYFICSKLVETQLFIGSIFKGLQSHSLSKYQKHHLLHIQFDAKPYLGSYYSAVPKNSTTVITLVVGYMTLKGHNNQVMPLYLTKRLTHCKFLEFSSRFTDYSLGPVATIEYYCYDNPICRRCFT